MRWPQRRAGRGAALVAIAGFGMLGAGFALELPPAWRDGSAAALARLSEPALVLVGSLLLAAAGASALAGRSLRRHLEWMGEAVGALAGHGGTDALDGVIARAPGELRAILEHLTLTLTLEREHGARARALASLDNEALVGVTVEGNVGLWTPGAERLFERDAGGALGRPALDLVPPWRREELEALLVRALGGKAVHNTQTQLRTERGRVLDALVSAARVPAEAPADIAVTLSWRDLTGVAGLGHAGLLASRALEASPDLLLVVEAEGDHTIRYASPGASGLCGFAADDLTGSDFGLLLDTASDPRVREEIERLFQVTVPRSFGLRFQRKDGTRFWGEVAAAPLEAADGRPRQLALTVRQADEQRAVLEQARQEAGRAAALLEATPVGAAALDAKGYVLFANPAMARLLEQSPGELLGRRLADLLPEEARDAPAGAEFETSGPSGRRSLVWLRRPELAAAADERGEAVFLLDVSGRRRMEQGLREALERAQVTLGSIAEAVVATRADGTIDYLNPAAEALLGIPDEETRGLPLSAAFELLDEEQREPLPDPVERCLRVADKVEIRDRALLVSRDRRERAVQLSAAPIRDTPGRLLGAVLVIRDVSELRMLARRVAHEATHDPLTGLVNRREFEFRVEQALAAPTRSGAVVFLDFDRFKEVNDRGSHAAGDELLRQLAALMRERLRPGDVLARLGGDEFGVLLRDCDAREALRIAEALCLVVREYHFVWDERTFRVGASAGLAALDGGHATLTDVMATADAACAEAKRAGRGRVHVHAGAGTTTRPAPAWGDLLRRAIENDGLRLLRQPIAPTGRNQAEPLPWSEILVRLVEQDGALLPAEAFLPAARRLGLLPSLDRWVVGAAFAQVARAKNGGSMLSINLAAPSLCEPGFVDFVCEQIERHDLAPERFCFELAEPDLMTHFAAVSPAARALAERGFRFALDDGGSGLVGFTDLRSLPFEFLKIHESLVQRTRDDEIAAVVFEATCRIAHVVGMRIVAEGVEDDATLQRVSELGADYAQGFVVGHPAPAADE